MRQLLAYNGYVVSSDVSHSSHWKSPSPLYDKALAIDPTDKVALNGKGSVLDSLVAIDPNYVDALTNKGVALYNLGNYTQAIKYINKALAIDPKGTYAISKKGDILRR